MSYKALRQTATIDRYAVSNGTQLVAGTTYTYDALNRLQQLSHKANGSNVASYTYGYDAASRITSLGSQFANAAYNDNSTYNYDNTNQLAGADHSAIGDEGYTYDANSNRTNTGYQTGTGNNNQLSSDGTYNYTYDNEGNLKTRTEITTGKVREFTWDYRNRLTGVTDKTGGTVMQQVSYTYDALNQRLAKTVGSQTTRFVYDRGNVYLEFSGTNTTPITRYLYGPMVAQVLAQESNGQTTWMLADHLGSVRDLVNNSGAVVNHFTYDSFGQVVGSMAGATVDTRYKFTGREYDDETGLYYYRARYFDAGVGRFIGQDPIGFSGRDTNLYRYVHNSPIDRVDPSGKADTRNPGGAGVVFNFTDRPVYVLVSGKTEDHYEKLYPGFSTPHQYGRSKDADGVWVWRGPQSRWKFYPVGGDGNFPGTVYVKEDRVERVYMDKCLTTHTVRLQAWDGILRSPGDPASRGREESRNPPNPKLSYPNASKWYPIKPEEEGIQNIMSPGEYNRTPTPMPGPQPSSGLRRG